MLTLQSVDPTNLGDDGHLCPSGTWLQLEPRWLKALGDEGDHRFLSG